MKKVSNSVSLFLGRLQLRPRAWRGLALALALPVVDAVALLGSHDRQHHGDHAPDRQDARREGLHASLGRGGGGGRVGAGRGRRETPGQIEKIVVRIKTISTVATLTIIFERK